MKDDALCAALRADLLSEYGVHLHSMYTDPGMSCVLVASLLSQLPESSRLMRRLRNDCLSQDQHLLLDIVDLLAQSAFMTTVQANVALGKQTQKVFKKAPNPAERPVFVKPEKPKFKFLSGKELRERFGGGDEISSRKKRGVDTDG